MTSRAEELDAHLRDHPEDLAAWKSYGDLLAAAGDQRAKLIALELAIRGGHTERRRELRALQENLKQSSGLTAENGIRGAFHFSAFRLQSLSGRAASALECLLDVPQLWGAELELQIDASQDLAHYVPVLLRARPSALRLDGANAAAEPWNVLPRAVLGELEELSLFLDRSSSLEPAPALLDVLEKTLSCTRLARLGLWDCKLDDAGLERLARAPAFRALERLTLGYENPGSVGLAALSHPHAFPKLRALGFCVGDFQAPPVAFLTSALAPRLEELCVWQTTLGAQFWEALFRTSALPALRVLDVEDSDFDDAQAQALARGPRRERLERLEMFFGELTQRSALALLRSENLPNLCLRTFVSDWDAGVRERFAQFGERFVLGTRHDCGTGRWAFEPRWRGTW